MADFNKYFKSLQSHKISEITEHSHRTNLQHLLEEIAGPKMKILHEPKREGKFGSPDYKVTITESIVGYVENKKVEESLDKILKSPQIKKYQALSDNILLTNYIEWIWIKDGKIQKRETLCFLTDLENKKAKLDLSKADAVHNLIRSFLSQAPKEIGDAKKLAEALAVRAKLLKDFLQEELTRQDNEHTEGRLYQLYETFKTFVFHELTVSEFSDAFAQNLVYGLFLAKLNAGVKPVSLNNAWDYIPATFELIRELVDFLKELKRDEYRETKWIVEEVLTIMNHLDLKAIQDSLSFTKRRKDKDDLTIKDPYVYFYEDFLAAYDKKLKEAKGVYYTPPPVVNFIVRAINDILKDTFQIKDGLADRQKVTVLDFATGTGTFLVEILQQIFDTLPKGSGKKELLIKEHVLKNLFGFEYLIAPYTIAHLKLSQFLKDNDYELQAGERLQVFLTNTLEPIDKNTKIPLLPALTEESQHAQLVKEKPILVITGNPPYSGHSKNPSETKVKLSKGIAYTKKYRWNSTTNKVEGIPSRATKDGWYKIKTDIGEKMMEYYFVDGKPLGEKNPKWLQDDYVKFIRFAQDKMGKVDEGIVGIITNHRFLTNPTFRGMRQSLMKTFNQIYILDLHGSNKPKEMAPDGGKDENVFDIEQGVAISLLIKKKGLENKVYHSDFWGTRKEKYKRSIVEEIYNIKWTELTPKREFFRFIPENDKLKDVYDRGFSIEKIFLKNTLAVVTGDDEMFIDFDESSLVKKLKASHGEERILKEKVKQIDYRVFDCRVIYYDTKLIERPRFEIMQNLLFENIALNSAKYGRKLGSFNYFVSKNITSKDLTSSVDSVNTFPLYLRIGETIEPNFSDYFKRICLEKYNFAGPNEIFSYIYAILYSHTYREKFAEFLKSEFPKIPFTDDKIIFQRLAELGKELIKVHLLQSKNDFDISLGHYFGKNHIVEKPVYQLVGKTGRLFINKESYFDNVPREVYEFYVGGYQVLEKYLKDRKGRNILKEIDHVAEIVQALAFTIDQMKKIDSLTKSWV
ncbi:MAG: N-6 DNA methylase [Chitinophagaceae bacterium]|nr:N-6 DNA methylase [Chitinophagaceae bacterium]